MAERCIFAGAMFLEPSFHTQRRGWIEVICGSMFSGKTEELIRRLRRARIADQSVEIFKPATDTRYSADEVVSHDARTIPSHPVMQSTDILSVASNIDVIGVDEAQFFDQEITRVCEELAMRGHRVIVAGLDMDFRGRPFGPMPDLLAVAEYITKLHAICNHCGNLATHTYRLTSDAETVVLGEKDVYEARCRHCYNLGNILKLRPKRH
ncbi:MAG TPA: thymidine kinase [Saprospiraceae bacterium]|nr:thymidine kinase [Saprospiraceae bacterium]